MNINEWVIQEHISGDTLGLIMVTDKGESIKMGDFIKQDTDTILKLIGIDEETIIRDETGNFKFLLLVVCKTIRALKEKLDNKRPVKLYQCKYCLTEFESKTKKTLCPVCRYEKDKECKKQWARQKAREKKK